MIMKNIEVLCWGIEHIAQNHNFEASTDYEEEGNLCIYGGCNVPTLQDVYFLCEDLGIDRECVDSSSWGIDVFITQEWYDSKGNQDYVPGLEMWKRCGFVVGN
jgi:hypothetical protein